MRRPARPRSRRRAPRRSCRCLRVMRRVHRVELSLSGERMSTVKTACPAMMLREFGIELHLADRADGVRLVVHRDLVHHLDDRAPCRARRCALGHRRRAGMRLLAGQRELQPSQALAVGDDADVDALVLEDRPLLDMQFEDRRASCARRPSRRPSSRCASARRRSVLPSGSLRP